MIILNIQDGFFSTYKRYVCFIVPELFSFVLVAHTYDF